MPKPKESDAPATRVDTDLVVDIHETAKQLHTTDGVLRKWRYQRKGPESFLLAGKVVYKQSAVNAYIEAERARTSRGGVPGRPTPQPAASTRRRVTPPTK